jgi:hypothetical protein
MLGAYQTDFDRFAAHQRGCFPVYRALANADTLQKLSKPTCCCVQRRFRKSNDSPFKASQPRGDYRTGNQLSNSRVFSFSVRLVAAMTSSLCQFLMIAIPSLNGGMWGIRECGFYYEFRKFD